MRSGHAGRGRACARNDGHCLLPDPEKAVLAHGWGRRVLDGVRLISGQDRCIERDDAGRRELLRGVTCLGRCPIRAGACCSHIAGRARGRLLPPMPHDFEAHDGLWPFLVESFVDEVYGGPCLRPASFRSAGKSTGRGRRDLARRRRRTEMMVSMDKTERAWRSKFGVDCVDHASVRPNLGLGARLGDKRLSALRAKSAELLAACPEPKFGVGIAAIHVVVVRRIMAMTPFGRRLPKFGSGLMFSVHQAVLLHDHALLRDTRAPDRIGGAVRVGGSSRSLARSQARFGVRNPDHVVPADPALDRVSWPARRTQRRPVACLAPRGMTCCNARLS